jgi:hypothetical protein
MAPAGVSLRVLVGTCRYVMGTCRYLLLFMSFESSDFCVVLGVLGLNFFILPRSISMGRCARLRGDRRCGVLFVSVLVVSISPFDVLFLYFGVGCWRRGVGCVCLDEFA